MYKIARDSKRPTPRPGAEAVAGPDARPSARQDREIRFEPSGDLEDVELGHEEEEKREEAVITTRDSLMTKQAPEVVHAELVKDTDSASMEERIVKRIFHQAPVAEVKPNSVQSDDNAPASRKKLWIILSVVALLVIAGAVVGIVFAVKPDSEDPAPREPATEAPIDWSASVCREFEEDDGTITIFCVKEHYPSPELMTIFLNCPDLEGENVLDCDTCGVVMAPNLQEWEEGDPFCNGCLICGDNISYDCTNISNEQCAKTNCAGDCTN